MTGRRQKKDYDYRKYLAWEGCPPLEHLVIQESQGAIPPRELDTLGTSDIGVSLFRRIWRKNMDAVEEGREPKSVQVDEQGVLRLDTFKGLAMLDDIRLGPENMESSENGRGLIRDAAGKLAFE